MFQSNLRKPLIFGACIVALWFSAKYILPVAMPFLLALLLALVAEPLVRFFQNKAHLPRVAATGIGMIITLVLLILLAMVLGALFLRELRTLVNIIPDLEGTAARGISVLEVRLLNLADNAPAGIRPFARQYVEGMFSDGTAVMKRMSDLVLNMATGVITRLPDSALSIGTWLLAAFMMSAKLPAIRFWLSRQLPTDWHDKYLPTLKHLKKAVFGWLFAQLRLVSITFAVLLTGFFILQIPYSLLWAALICLVDALPILGTGTVLVPWSLICFLQGDHMRGIGLLGVFAAVSLLRSVLEPKLVGKQLGLDPLVTLAAMYTGYRLWGILGMLLAPLLAVVILQFFTSGKHQK